MVRVLSMIVLLSTMFWTSFCMNICLPGQTYQINSCLPIQCSNYLKRIHPNPQRKVEFYNDTRGSIETFSDHVTVSFLFKDEQSAGTFQRDNDDSCIGSELMRTNKVLVPLGFNESVVSSTYDYITGYRNWSFILPQSQWSLLQESQITDVDHYTGHYAFRFNISDTVLYTYYFSFSFALNKEGQLWGKSQYIQQDVQNLLTPCTPGETAVMQTKIRFAKTYSVSACADALESPSLFYNQQLFVCVEIVDPMLKSCQIRAPHLHLLGFALYYQMQTTASMYLSPGIWIFQVTVPFIYQSVQVSFTGQSSGSYSTEQSIPVFGFAETPVCIRMAENDTVCPTQEQLKTYGPKAENTIANNTNVNVTLFMKMSSSFITLIIITFI